MNKNGFLKNVKIAVLLGYILLFLLSVFGGYQIYKELLNFSKNNKPFAESKQLNLISNALVTMYKSESVKKIMLSENPTVRNLDSLYKAENKNITLYLDSLHTMSNDKNIHASLDTVNNLLIEKDKNLQNILRLLEAIKKLPYSKQILTTVLSKNDISNLMDIFESNIQKRTIDSSFITTKKKGFFSRIKDVFVAGDDSTKVISKQNSESKDSTFKRPAQLLTDTVVQFINHINIKSDRKKAKYLNELSQKYSSMLNYDELLTGQIHNILYNLETKERKYVTNMLVGRNEVVSKSSRMMSIIAWASILTVLIFIILTLFLINKSESFKNKLEESKKRAEDLMKSRERLLLMISHDIKSPLSSIIGYLELISKDKMSQAEKGHFDSMKNSSEHILELVNKLMDYHKLEQGKSELNKITFYPHQLVEDIYQSFVPIIGNKLSYNLQNKIQQHNLYESDPFIIKQVVNNLISNAIKFTKKGKVQLYASLDDTNLLTISVQDTGVGIKSDDIKKIFDEFERVGSQTDQNKIEGFGLGLAITYKLVKLLNGDIVVKSEYGKGSEFTIQIPLATVQQTTRDILAKNDEKLPQRQLTGKKILFVDDDLVMLNVYEKLLQREGAVVTLCSGSKEALEAIKKDKFDIILTDIQMPQMNGFEFAKKIRKSSDSHYKQVNLVALSARTDVSEKDFKSAGFTAFLPKPVRFNAMLDKIHELLLVTNPMPELTISNAQTKGIGALIEYVEDDEEASKDILTTFESENRIKLNELKTGLKNNNWEQIQMTSHKLLPLMTMIDAKEMIPLLVKLENGDQNIENVKNLIEMLKRTNDEVSEFIKNKFV